nr:hypothetical protein HK105_005641 [Polyrhizophydium stewartii]
MPELTAPSRAASASACCFSSAVVATDATAAQFSLNVTVAAPDLAARTPGTAVALYFPMTYLLPQETSSSVGSIFCDTPQYSAANASIVCYVGDAAVFAGVFDIVTRDVAGGPSAVAVTPPGSASAATLCTASPTCGASAAATTTARASSSVLSAATAAPTASADPGRASSLTTAALVFIIIGALLIVVAIVICLCWWRLKTKRDEAAALNLPFRFGVLQPVPNSPAERRASEMARIAEQSAAIERRLAAQYGLTQEMAMAGDRRISTGSLRAALASRRPSGTASHLLNGSTGTLPRVAGSDASVSQTSTLAQEGYPLPNGPYATPSAVPTLPSVASGNVLSRISWSYDEAAQAVRSRVFVLAGDRTATPSAAHSVRGSMLSSKSGDSGRSLHSKIDAPHVSTARIRESRLLPDNPDIEAVQLPTPDQPTVTDESAPLSVTSLGPSTIVRSDHTASLPRHGEEPAPTRVTLLVQDSHRHSSTSAIGQSPAETITRRPMSTETNNESAWSFVKSDARGRSGASVHVTASVISGLSSGSFTSEPPQMAHGHSTTSWRSAPQTVGSNRSTTSQPISINDQGEFEAPGILARMRMMHQDSDFPAEFAEPQEPEPLEAQKQQPQQQQQQQ